MVYIYCRYNSSRLAYIANHLFRNILGTAFTCTTDRDFFLNQEGICINYSEENLGKGIWIFPHGLLSETGIHPIKDLQEAEWEGLFCFFRQEKGDIPFDLFAASFYLLTLYEEHFPEQLDKHLRFDFRESLAYRKGFLEIPIIDRWVYQLKDMIIRTGSDTSTFNYRRYKVISTFDIDHPYLYRNKGLVKNFAGACRDLLKGNFSQFRERFCVLTHLRTDPYFKVLYWIDAFQKNIRQTYYLFILISSYGLYGRSTIYPQRRYFNYLKSLQKVNLGLHPSYSTFVNARQTREEKKKLERILGQEVAVTRQHFLRMKNPETFQILNKCGFTEDFTLAFAQTPGFRSGTAIPYCFYDTNKEEETALLIRPTIMMDSTLIIHLKMSPQEALQKMKALANACKQSGGDYLMLWHNSNLAGNPKKNPWINVFIESYQYALSLESNTFGGKFDQHDSK